MVSSHRKKYCPTTPPPDRWIPDCRKGVKFIDDISAAIKCDVTSAQMHISTDKESFHTQLFK